MLSPENIPPTAANNSTNPKTTPPKPPQEQPQKCPRCDSSNTKFCYYNNYSLTQPRHFCKTCRRYWTRGGALRNVPIGGGCRKTNKKLKTATTPTSSKLGFCGAEFGPGFKFMNPVGHTPASMEFNLGGLHPATAGVYTQFITSTTGPTPGCGPYFGLDLLGLNYSATNSAAATSSVVVQGNNNTTTGGNEHQISIASIESLSSINQEMHWKLQQQRLSLIYGATSLQKDEDSKVAIIADENDQDKPQGAINLFNNLEINISNNHNNSDAPRKIDVGPNELLFDQIQTSGNYGGDNNSCDNVNQVGGSNLHGVWGDLLHHNNHNHNHNHHHHQQQQLQFNGLH